LVSQKEYGDSEQLIPVPYSFIDGARELAITEERYSLDCWDKGLCPYCGKLFPETRRVGSGQKKKAGFCSLEGYAEYYKLDIRERLRRFVGSGATEK